MLMPAPPKEEQRRRQSLRDLDIVETPAQVRCERLTRLARQLFDVPVALVHLFDGERGGSKLAAELGEALGEFLPHVHAAPPDSDVFVVEDALADPRFRDNPSVAGAPHVRFFAAYRLAVEPGMDFGTFCILDVAPRRFSGEEVYQLRDLARMAERELIALAYTRCELRAGGPARRATDALPTSGRLAPPSARPPGGVPSSPDHHHHRAGDKMSYTSGCACGAVQLELAGEPPIQAYCHCSSCRGWLGAPLHAATLWPTGSVKVTKGAENLGMYQRTEKSQRQFCRSCGAPVLIGHPAIGMTDVPAGSIQAFAFKPALHVHYGEKVMAVKDGLPKFKDFPKDFGGSGDMLPE